MFNKEIDKMISYLKKEKDCIEISEENIYLKEKSKDGEAELKLMVNNPCIVFKQVDKNLNSYLHYKRCADSIIFEKVNDTWILHILEFKKTVKSKEWNGIKEQFLGGFLNARSLAGYLGINIDYNNIKLYTCFRNDKIRAQRAATLIELRSQVGKSLKNTEVDDWESGQVELYAFNKLKCEHSRIILDKDTGGGSYSLF